MAKTVNHAPGGGVYIDCNCCGGCPNCVVDPPASIIVALSGEDLNGTANGFDISGGLDGGSTQFPLQMTSGVSSVDVEIIHSSNAGCIGTISEPAYTINYSDETDLQTKLKNYLESILLGTWTVVVTDAVSHYEVTSISGSVSNRALCEFSLFQGVENELRDSFTISTWQDQCLLDMAGNSNIFGSGESHATSGPCAFTYNEALACGGMGTGTLNLAATAFDVSGGTTPITGVTTSGTVLCQITYSEDAGCGATSVVSKDIIYTNASSLQIQVEQYLQSEIGGTWTVVVGTVGPNIRINSSDGVDSIFALCELKLTQGPAVSTRSSFINTEKDVMSYSLVITDSLSQELVSAYYITGDCGPFDCDLRYPFKVVRWNNGRDQNGNILAELENTSGSFNANLGIIQPCASAAPPPPLVTVNAPDSIVTWNETETFFLDLSGFVTVENCVSPTYEAVSTTGNGVFTVVGSDLQYVPSGEVLTAVDLVYRAICNGVVDEGTITLDLYTVTPPPMTTIVHDMSNLSPTEQATLNNYVDMFSPVFLNGGFTTRTVNWGADPQIDNFLMNGGGNASVGVASPRAINANADGSVTFFNDWTMPEAHTMVAVRSYNGTMVQAGGCSGVYTFPNQQYTCTSVLELVDNGTDWEKTSSSFGWVNMFQIWEPAGAVGPPPFAIILRPQAGNILFALTDTVGTLATTTTTPGSPVTTGSASIPFGGAGLYTMKTIWNFSTPSSGTITVDITGPSGNGRVLDYSGVVGEGNGCGNGQVLNIGAYCAGSSSPHVAEIKYHQWLVTTP